MTEDVPITRRRAETQARLLDAAIEVFAERGVLAATVEEICDQAGYTRGAFYSNFASKDELVLALLNADSADSAAGVSELVSDSVKANIAGTREEAINMAAGLWMQARTTNRYWSLVQSEIKLYAARVPAIRDAYIDFRDRFRTSTIEALRPVIENYGLELSMPIEVAVDALADLFQSAMINAIMALPEGEMEIKNLDPQILGELLRPMRVLLDQWIVDAKVPALSPHPVG